MRKLLLSLCLLVLPLFAAAQDREALLTPDGTLFTVSTSLSHIDASSAEGHLVLRSQRGDEVTSEIVPATLERGLHTEADMAYDAESQTLFVFWLNYTSVQTSDLMFAWRDANGTWSEAKTFGQQFDYHSNLRIAATRKASEEDGTVNAESAISVHLVWWENNTENEESAQYAMLALDKNGIESFRRLDLTGFAADAEGDALAPDADRSILKQPLLFASPQQDSVLVVFGDPAKEELHQVRVRPTRVVAEGRLRVPVGRHERSNRAPSFRVAGTSRMEGIAGESRLALYNRDTARLQYAIMKEDGTWSEARSITLDEQITSSAAIDALRRLLNEH
ncbi:MAG TPA: hypothetical protein VE974_30115 [Thermoanaerobaculia bacterium]|nr:hypothetical protein [Thermoanaerobaculia bacterium]